MKRKLAIWVATILLLFAISLEFLRNKGEIAVSGRAVSLTNAIAVNLTVRNKDWRTPLGQFVVVLNTDGNWKVSQITDEGDTAFNVEENTFGPLNEFHELVIAYPKRASLLPHKSLNLRFVLLSRSANASPLQKVQGRVSYIGARIWEEVGEGQLNSEYFTLKVLSADGQNPPRRVE